MSRAPARALLHHGGPGPRPLVWCTGPDPVRHSQFVAWGRARAQAVFRHEPWQLTFDDFVQVWGTRWPERGRGRDQLCMTRRAPDLPWSATTVELITRAEHNRRCAGLRHS